jgi:serine/threonine protein kinase
MGVDFAEEEQFGPYLVYERLGVGGMATVHRALERGIEGFERIVALKRLLPHLAEDASFIKSFVREAKLASILNHVNIVQIFELGRVGTEYFISMEYIDGKDIRRILRHARKVTGPPPIHVTVGLMLQLCEALEYAHSKVDDHGTPLGLVHRDVSPSNLLVTQAGHLKVIDFGIAKAQSQQLRTQTGRVKGKLAYMAPEAVSGRELDSRSDLFAAGVILHELLTARPLFARKNEYETLIKVQRGEILPPSTFNQACPSELDAICLRALERDPDERWTTAADMRDELLALRRRLNLQTGHRDIAQWLTWAFSIEAPNAGFAAAGTGADHSLSFDSRSMRRTPAPRREDDEAVEIAWGGGDERGSADPVVLDDVPDVSEKHIDPNGERARFAAAAFGNLEDDIPMSGPSHGHGARAFGGHDDALDSIPDEVPAAPPSRRVSVPMPAQSRAPTQQSLVSSSPRAATIVPQQVKTPRPRLPTVQPALARTPASTQPPASRNTPVPTRNTPPPPPRTTPPPLPASSGQMPKAEPSAFGNISTRERRITARGAGAPPPRDSSAQIAVPEPPMRRGHPDTLDPEVEMPALEARKPPTTPPTDVITARPSTAGIESDGVPIRSKRASDVTIGSAMIQREKGKKTWVIFAGLAVAGAAATAVTLMATKGADEVEVKPNAAAPGATHMTPERIFGTVKFLIEPSDAEIKLVEKQLDHAGSPWTTQLEPGIHQIQIQREGYKTWLTSIELSANETQTLRVVLEPMSKAEPTEATLILTSTPDGLDAFLDGKALGTTPIKAQIRPGNHTITIRKDDVEVWKHELVAKANANYEFSPEMTEAKQRERAQRASTPKREVEAPAPAPAQEDKIPPAPPAPTPPPPPAPAIEKTVEKQPVVELPKPPAPTTPPAPPPAAAKPPAPTTPAITVQTPNPAPPAVPKPSTAPVTVPPNAVKKVAGDTPTIGKSKRGEVPPVVAAKVCIDTAGKVSHVDIISKVERITMMDLTHALKTWRYEPFKKDGVAVPACFSVSFRVQ